jgi:hypothetical protein
MKAFHCQGCGSPISFENVKCITCGHVLGFLTASCELAALEPAEGGVWRELAAQNHQFYRFCSNSLQHQVCNWMIAADDPNSFCASCRLNTLIPNLSARGNADRWHKLELAKRRVIYTIMRLGLPMGEEPAQNRPALRFNFISDLNGGPDPLTGHLNGLIVINIAEADDDERERRRVHLHEPYRTLVGHFRHEVAHYYWDRLIANAQWLVDFRKLFGDESADYGAALRGYYERGAPSDWQVRHVSAYASAHPWEDWAEAWAHYFHIVDMVETAEGFGMTLAPNHPEARPMAAPPRNGFDVNMSFDAILENWFPLTYALNELNRGMGLPDVYPFSLSAQAVEKLRFIHKIVRNNANHEVKPN